MTNDDNDAQGEFADIAGCGRQLRRTREKLGWSVDDVAFELRLSPARVAALEADDWSQLAGATYARGYLRSYARLLGVDAEQLLAGANTQEIEITRQAPAVERPGAEESAAAPDAVAASGSDAGGARRWLGLLALAVLAGLGYWQYRGAEPLLPGGAGEPVAQHERSPVMASEETAPVSSPAPSWDENEWPATPTQPRRVVFEFRQGSWVEVRDARDQRLLYRSFDAGRRIQVEGQPPFRVYLGNASAVQVEYMGSVVEPDDDSQRLYARFKLGVSSPG